MGALERVPAWATTGVGSLPFTDPGRAAAHAVAAYDIPFCPQLPRLEGDMVGQWLGANPRRCGWSPERDRERPRAGSAFLSELAAHPPDHGLVKLQVTGPATLACALERERGGAPSRTEALALAGELAGWLANVAGQIRALGERGLDALIVVDEPAVGAFGVRGVEAAWEPLRAVAPSWGLHLHCRKRLFRDSAGNHTNDRPGNRCSAHPRNTAQGLGTGTADSAQRSFQSPDG